MFNVLLKLLLEHLHLLEVLVHLVLHLVLVLVLLLLLLVRHLHLLHDVSLLSFLGARRHHLRHVLVEQLGVHVAHISHVPHVAHVVTHHVHETRVFSIGWR